MPIFVLWECIYVKIWFFDLKNCPTFAKIFKADGYS